MNTIWILILISGSLPPGKSIGVTEFKTEAKCEAKAAAVERQSPGVGAICLPAKKDA